MALASGITHPWPGPSLWGWRDLNSRPLTMEVEGDAAAAADRGDPGFGAVVARADQTVAQASSTEGRCGTGLPLPEPLGRAVCLSRRPGAREDLWASGL